MDVSYKGTVKNGVVVLLPEAKLPEGTTVKGSVNDIVILDSWQHRSLSQPPAARAPASWAQ